MLHPVRHRRVKVSPQVKRMTLMLFLYTRLYTEKNMRFFMEELKNSINRRNKDTAQKII